MIKTIAKLWNQQNFQNYSSHNKVRQTLHTSSSFFSRQYVKKELKDTSPLRCFRKKYGSCDVSSSNFMGRKIIPKANNLSDLYTYDFTNYRNLLTKYYFTASSVN